MEWMALWCSLDTVLLLLLLSVTPYRDGQESIAELPGGA
jgi:hypothetical protein